MRNRSWVVGVLLVAGWAACATRTRETSGGAAASGQQALEDGLPGAQQTDGGCAVDPCADGGAGCLDIVVERSDSGKRFDPRPGVKGWKLCTGQGLEVLSEMDKDLCIDLRDLRSVVDGGVVALTKLPSRGSWTDDTLTESKYCLSICDARGKDCSAGCPSDCITDGQTIRGNLDVVTKVPDPNEDPD